MWTEGNDAEAISRGIYNTYTSKNLRYSQVYSVIFSVAYHVITDVDLKSLKDYEFFIRIPEYDQRIIKYYFSAIINERKYYCKGPAYWIPVNLLLISVLTRAKNCQAHKC